MSILTARKIRKRALKATAAAVAVLSLCASCDSLFLEPFGRTNPNDPKASILSFEAERYGDGNIAVGWDWLDQDWAALENGGREVLVDKIAVAHSVGGRPTGRGGAQEIAVDESRWYLEYIDIEPETEHYFALYAHEKDGGWLAPIYTSRYAKRTTKTGVSTYDIYEAVYVDANAMTSTVLTTPATKTVGNGKWIICYFNDMNNTKIFTEATLNLEVMNVSSGATLELYPLRYEYHGDAGVEDFLNAEYIIHSGKVSREIPSTGPLTLESSGIMDLVTRINYQHTGGIAVTASGGTVDITGLDTTTYIEAAYYHDVY